MYLPIESNSAERAEIITRKKKSSKFKINYYRKNILKRLYKKVNIINLVPTIRQTLKTQNNNIFISLTTYYI